MSFPKSQVNLPEINKVYSDSDVDLSLLDAMNVDDFMSLIKARQERSQITTWDTTVTLAQQLKILRSLLSSTSNILSKQVDFIDFEKILDIAHKTLNAERIVILKYDEKEGKLIVIAAREQTIKGTKVDIHQSSEGEVFRTGRRRRISDIKKDSVFISFMDNLKESNLKKVSSVICSPISVDGKVIGIIEACNRLPLDSTPKITPRKGMIDHIPFNQYDDTNLEFIASIIGLLWGQQSIQQQSSSSLFTVKEPSPYVSSIQAGADYDSFLDWIINETYKHLEADRVSLFTYNDKTKKLECKISQDIKGMALPTDTGIIGTVFSTLEVMTIDDAKRDHRHYHDIDKNIGYQTKTIICAPVIDQNGHPVGVIQALNKKDGKNFNSMDVRRLSELCEKTASALRQKTLIENRSVSVPSTPGSIEQGDLLTKSVVSIMEASSLSELTNKVEQLSTSWGNCEHASIYLITTGNGSSNNLSPALPSPRIKSFRKLYGEISRDDISSPSSPRNTLSNEIIDYSLPEIIQIACQNNEITEHKVADDTNPPEIFFGDYPSVRRVLICPINLKILLKENESAVLILGRKNTIGNFGNTTKKNVELLIQIIERSAKLLSHNLSSRNSQTSVSESNHSPTILSHKHILSAILNEIRDYIILFNGKGYILGTNRSIAQILGIQDPMALTTLSSLCGHFSNELSTPEYHYTSLVGNHKILCSDISSMLLLPRNNNIGKSDHSNSNITALNTLKNSSNLQNSSNSSNNNASGGNLDDSVANISDDDMIKRSNYEIKPGYQIDYVIKSLLVDVDLELRGTDNDILAIIISPSESITTNSSPFGKSLIRKSSTTSIIPQTYVMPAIETIRQSIGILEKSLGNDQDIVNNIHHMSSVLDTVTQLLSAQTTPRDYILSSNSPAIKATISKFGSRFASSVKVISSLSSNNSSLHSLSPEKSTIPSNILDNSNSNNSVSNNNNMNTNSNISTNFNPNHSLSSISTIPTPGGMKTYGSHMIPISYASTLSTARTTAQTTAVSSPNGNNNNINNNNQNQNHISSGHGLGLGTCNEIHLINNPVDSLSPLQNHPLVVKEIAQPPNLFSWEFNVLEYKELNQLRNICGRLFNTMFDFSTNSTNNSNSNDIIAINPKVLGSYIYDVSNSYHANPFHNFHHATTTLHFATMLLQTIQKKELSKLQTFAVMLSALVHDVDHPGNTNLFEIHTQSRLALRYNDQSVLENHHCSVAFQIMKEPRANVLGTLPSAQAAETRKIMISCILATDMSVHFQLVDEIKGKISLNCDFRETNDKLFLSKIILHASDLSNPVRPFHISTQWARNISEEFNRQVSLETSLGLPVLGFMMTSDEKSFCKNELGFASFVVAPMWRNLATLFPEFDHLVKQLDSNLNSWKSKIEEIDSKVKSDSNSQNNNNSSNNNSNSNDGNVISPIISPTGH